tara:strand:+ start:177 stop:749 length:573 start_codon:yes stop_codon:yes gene_type:complete
MNYEKIENLTEDIILRSYVEGSRQISNLFLALAASLGGFGFFLAGISSFLKINLLLFSDSTDISFIPQGIALTFYGTIGIILGIFLLLTIWWNVGYGYNEYDKNQRLITIYRKGYPGKKRKLKLQFSFQDVKSIKLRITEGLNPRRQLFLCLKDSREIPLIGIDQPLALTKIENEAINLAKYLNIYLETD